MVGGLRARSIAGLGPLAGGAALALLAGCSGEAATAGADESPEEASELVVFVYDRSTSIPDHQLELARQLTEARLDELDHGDRIAGMQLLQLSLAEPPERWSQPIPPREVEDFEVSRDSVARVRFLRDAKILLRRLSEPEGRSDINGTDILSTMHDVAEELRPYRDHEATLYLFSDMLQSNRTIEMEGLRRMPPADWVQTAKANGRLPDLSGLCVVIVGARVDTPAAQRIKAFWHEYFEATGARLEDRNYMLRPVRLPVAPCGSPGP